MTREMNRDVAAPRRQREVKVWLNVFKIGVTSHDLKVKGTGFRYVVIISCFHEGETIRKLLLILMYFCRRLLD